ncbi:putative bifunctional diguanylate cyclase/phosphodiesterase [Alkalilimnicola ehrlichii MLHE-1]|uniref:Diguanylate cyclase/phosphodiesterase n=1 Tax=Alkalilimnicola ehrlichii (strain ATCC BAA-1101 / DSM 17681 / MLHE-1) TaxID=187272 RepID=Q0A6X9_ALKEH|nr:EAL domain-containing protein [Alkalilimnicola ehrlichii]ABI57408.1 diguanylate cyclase/phosphodiesterase [Alkalilimnicola ehrlichii MLHE-1]
MEQRPNPESSPDPEPGAPMADQPAFRLAPVAQLILDEGGTIHALNEQARAFLEASAEPLRQRPFWQLMVDGDAVRLQRALANQRPEAGVRRYCGLQLAAGCRVDLSVRHVGAGRLLCALEHVPPGTGDDKEVARLAREVREQRTALERLAHYDALTGLPNRWFFERFLDNQLQRAGDNDGHQIAVLVLDLDHFKAVNDRFGHSEGDQVLKEATRRILACVRDVDMVSRIGGDEFVVVLGRLRGRGGASRVARALIRSLSRPFTVGARSHRLTASVGVAFYPKDGETVEDLIRRADLAMFQAKDRGRNGWAAFDYEHEHHLLEEDHWKGLLWRTIDAPGRYLTMNYQPILRLRDGRPRPWALEALLRVQGHDQQTLDTGTLVRAAEEHHMILPLGEAIFARICAEVAAMRQEGMRLPVTVNLSADQFLDPCLVGRMDRVCQAHGVPMNALCFEITETALVRNLSGAREMVQALQAAGALILLDDFGSGYASLSQLHSLPVDVLKIDAGFIAEVGRSPQAEALIRAILAMARALGIDVVAEGVETNAQRVWLEREGVQGLQGYYFSRPLPREAVQDWVRIQGLADD